MEERRVDDVVILLTKCQRTGESYGMRAERVGVDHWTITWAFPIKETSGKKEGYDKSEIKGTIDFDPEYPGCPYCGNMSWIHCGSCGHMNCGNTGENGAFKCKWCGNGGKVSTYDGGVISANTNI